MNRGKRKIRFDRQRRALRLVGAAPRAYDGERLLVTVQRIRKWEVPEPGAAGKQTGGCGAVAVAGTRDPDRGKCGGRVYESALTGGASALSSEATDLIIRDADPADAKVIASIHVDTWRSSYAGMIPDRVLVGMSATSQQAQWARQLRRRSGGEFALVAQDSVHGIIGFGSAGPTRGNAPYQGEVYTLYVHPDCQGQGIGKRLLSGLFDGLRERDLNSAVVWVLAMNPARFFYEAMGGARSAEREEKVWGELLPEFAYGWATLDITAGVARA